MRRGVPRAELNATLTDRVSLADLRGGDTVAPPIGPSGALVCLVGPEPGQVFSLGADPMRIGRADDAELRLDGPDISRHHARITWSDGHFTIEDLGSRNGVQVNGVPVQRHALSVSDRIQIGLSVILVFARPDDLERRAQRLQKLEGLAQLAGGLVHDFKNVLHVIVGFADVAVDEVARGVCSPTLVESVHAIRHAAKEASGLTQRLLFFARRDSPTPSNRVEVLTLVQDALALVRRSLAEKRIAIDVGIPSELQVRGDASELHHALLNLFLNAQEAMPQGGQLSIAARRLDLGNPEAKRLHLRDAGDYVEIGVSDTGVGMDDLTMAHVFEPFFTTKPTGTGLGLSTVFGVVRHHGGNVLVDSVVGKGTCFRVLLPA